MIFNWKELTFVHCAMFVTFIMSSFTYNIILLISYLIVRPISLELYRKISGILNWSMHAQVLVVGTRYSGSRGRIFADPQIIEECGQNHGIFLMNHHYEVDWVFTWMMAEWNDALQNGKVIAKKMLKYVPTVGWAWALTDTIFLDRNWEKDRKNLEEGMRVLGGYKTPVWLLIFPEGTRLNQEKLRLGQEFSRGRGLPVYEHHLVPRTKGFAQIMEHLNTDKFKYVYDVSLGIDKARSAPPKMTSMLMGRPVHADLYIRRISTKDIPKDQEGVSQFLFELFKEKDLLMDSYFKSGCKSFTSHLPESEGNKFKDYEPIDMAHRIGPVINSLLLNSIVCLPILYKLGAMVFSGSMVQMSIAFVLVTTVYLSLKSFISITKIKEN